MRSKGHKNQSKTKKKKNGIPNPYNRIKEESHLTKDLDLKCIASICQDNDLEDLKIFFSRSYIYLDYKKLLKLFPKHMSVSKIETLDSEYFISSIFGFCNYLDIKTNIKNNLVTEIDAILDRLEADHKFEQNMVRYVVSERIVNLPINIFMENLKNIEIENYIYIYISKLFKIEEENKNEVFSTFKEFKKDDLICFPDKAEEIFLIKYSLISKVINISNVNFRISVLDHKSMKKYFYKIFEETINK
ncbi:hypothetical protein CWI37_0901p0010 [Hamiltosporidium tvaerminnensis]|uniref:Uncharacterized protein n=1 Tax=Hamiltosporidium tvaerminnensis TaxID=1176355 RepID=A0A4Q9L062_9MICR|nr:hypothetical protein CWI37_0924p0010 [Hamiltosporidium tvaerminnensis]TBU00789.1 hypothetical protein CWI37_0901p0010 [Hamiltosporidium tvaerminnensis]